jgi:hypothetical protein
MCIPIFHTKTLPQRWRSSLGVNDIAVSDSEFVHYYMVSLQPPSRKRRKTKDDKGYNVQVSRSGPVE